MEYPWETSGQEHCYVPSGFKRGAETARCVPTRASGPPGCRPLPSPPRIRCLPRLRRRPSALCRGRLPLDAPLPCVWTLLPELLPGFLAQVSGDRRPPRGPASGVMLNQLLKGSETQFPLKWNQDDSTSCAGVAQSDSKPERYTQPDSAVTSRINMSHVTYGLPSSLNQ